jgi:hypothetical protein
MPIPEAEEVIIKVRRINWELLDDYYRYEWDDPEWLARKENESEAEFKKRIKPVGEWEKRKKQLLESIARRVKYEVLMGRVVGPGHLGKLSYKSIYDAEQIRGIAPDYQVHSTKPPRDVRISENTNLVVVEEAASTSESEEKEH